jgi:hypothetical protein
VLRGLSQITRTGNSLGTPSVNFLLFVSVQEMNILSFEGRTDDLRMSLLSIRYSEVEKIRN